MLFLLNFSLESVDLSGLLLALSYVIPSKFQSGIGGSFWFTIAIVIDILLFPCLSLKLKTRAPGAKTFPQVLHKLILLDHLWTRNL